MNAYAEIMQQYALGALAVALSFTAQGQSDTSKPKERTALKYNLNASGSHFFQVTFANQTWVRYTESNPGTTRFSKSSPDIFDIGLRRTRIQMFGQLND